ncbi:MAG: DNA alkylation repair protein [Candidatus Micrarchaeia archaeon]
MDSIKAELDSLADPGKARILSGFFKTRKGEYGEGDVFLGIPVPLTRKIVKRHKDISFGEVRGLLGSRVHEHRLAGLLALVDKFDHGDERQKRAVYGFYMRNIRAVNNWDLVDCSAGRIVGAYVFGRDGGILRKLARSGDLWERRIAVIATSYFIRKGRFDETLLIAGMLLHDRHDLIHKAVGWMLREMGKNGGLPELEAFLGRHHGQMPRTMLRYAIERLGPEKRGRYMGSGHERRERQAV